MADIPILFSAPMVRALLAGRKTQTRRIIKGGVPEAPGMDAIFPSNVARHPAPYLDAYCGERKTPANPRGMSRAWCWWTRDDRQCLPTFRVKCMPGERLWVRETWALGLTEPRPDGVEFPIYAAEYRSPGDAGYGTLKPWRPSIHMPRALSRLTLTVTDVRVQRLQDISEEDAAAEGCTATTGEAWWQGYMDVQSSDGVLLHQHFSGDSPPDWMIDPKPAGRDRFRDQSAKEAFSLLWETLHGPGAWDANPYVAATTFTVEQRNIGPKS